MLRKELADHPFNKEAFRAVLIKARGDRSQAEFSEDCSISYSYLNKYTNARFSEAPTLQTLKKIAAASKDVTYADLLEAAGYDVEKYKYGKSIKEAISDCTSGIFLGMASSPYDWKIESSGCKDGEPMEILIEKQEVKKWFFIPVIKEDITKEGTLEILLNHPKFVQGSKVSSVTGEEGIFEKLKSIEFPLLSLYVSAIKLKGKEVEDEAEITTSLKSDITIVHKGLTSPFIVGTDA